MKTVAKTRQNRNLRIRSRRPTASIALALITVCEFVWLPAAKQMPVELVHKHTHTHTHWKCHDISVHFQQFFEQHQPQCIGIFGSNRAEWFVNTSELCATCLAMAGAKKVKKNIKNKMTNACWKADGLLHPSRLGCARTYRSHLLRPSTTKEKLNIENTSA